MEVISAVLELLLPDIWGRTYLSELVVTFANSFLWSLQTNSYHGMGFISLYCSCVGMYLTSCTLALYLSEWKTEFLICQYVFRRSLLTARLSHCILIQHFYDVLRFEVVGMQLSKENTYTKSHFRIHCTVQELWIFCVLRINYLTYNRWH
jgi:hypothetical protein